MRLARTVAAACLIGGLFPLTGMSGACAAEGPSAVLVVDTGDPGAALRYCVELPDGSVTGLELIELAHDQHGLDYRFGYGGNAVCVLAGVGYESDECLKDGPEFWGYWRGDGSGGWDWSSSGGNATSVEDGDVEGWAWGTGADGSSHQQPPATTFESVCGEPPESSGSKGDKGGRSEKASNERSGGSGSSGSKTVTTGSESVVAAEDGSKKTRKKESARHHENERHKTSRSGRVAVATLTPAAPPEQIPSVPTSAEDEGPPAGGLLAMGGAAGLMVAGVLIQRRRVRSP